MSSLIEGLKETIYDLNHGISSSISEIPGIGDELVGTQKVFCEYIMNPLIINGTYVGCDAIDDVYNGLPDNSVLNNGSPAR